MMIDSDIIIFCLSRFRTRKIIRSIPGCIPGIRISLNRLCRNWNQYLDEFSSVTWNWSDIQSGRSDSLDFHFVCFSLPASSHQAKPGFIDHLCHRICSLRSLRFHRNIHPGMVSTCFTVHSESLLRFDVCHCLPHLQQTSKNSPWQDAAVNRLPRLSPFFIPSLRYFDQNNNLPVSKLLSVRFLISNRELNSSLTCT